MEIGSKVKTTRALRYVVKGSTRGLGGARLCMPLYSDSVYLPGDAPGEGCDLVPRGTRGFIEPYYGDYPLDDRYRIISLDGYPEKGTFSLLAEYLDPISPLEQLAEEAG